jgi:hypothetical protein
VGLRCSLTSGTGRGLASDGGPNSGDTLITIQFTWALLTLACAAVSIGTAIFIGSRMQWKRLWVFISLLGLGAFSLNWSTGAFHISPLAVQLLAAGDGPAGIILRAPPASGAARARP